MKILFVSPYPPSPPQFGAQRRVDGLMRGLTHRHEVSLLSFMPPEDTQLEVTRGYCKRLIAVQHDVVAQGVAGKRLLQLRSLFSRDSFEALMYRTPNFQSHLEQMVREEGFDIVQFEFSQMAVYQLPRGGARSPRYVLDEHNIEYEVVKRIAESEGSLVRKVYSAVDWRKVRNEEFRAWRTFDGVALTSARDEEVLQQDERSVPTTVIPNAVDLEGFRPNDTPIVPDTLLFLGAMNYHPNIEGVEYFLDEMWPAIRARRPKAKVIVVGRNPPPSIVARKTEHVEITGYVDDPRAYLDRAAVVIVPLRIGGGTRFKIVEAMAKGKAIVSTSLGAEGLEVEHEKNLLLADDPAAFVEQTCRLLADPELAARLGKAGRRLAEDRYGWQAAVEKLEQFYEQLLAKPPRALRA